MTTATLSPLPVQKFFDNNGIPLLNGQLFTYSAGTSNLTATFTDSTAGTPNTNPVILNARGEANVWIYPNTGYKFVLQDSLGNTIWTVDNIFNSQLTTLYGGVDTGITNAYALTFNSPFQFYSNGEIIYFVAGTTNTGPSTLNVNSLGPVNILNQNGAALTAGQIVSGSMIGVIYYNGNFILLFNATSVGTTGAFTATVVGGTNAPLSCAWSISGSTVNINLPYCSFTSTSTGFSLSGLPTNLQPASAKSVPLSVMQNNTAIVTNVAAQLGGTAPGSITFLLGGLSAGWTASGIKGIGYYINPIGYGITLQYNLL